MSKTTTLNKNKKFDQIFKTQLTRFRNRKMHFGNQIDIKVREFKKLYFLSAFCHPKQSVAKL